MRLIDADELFAEFENAGWYDLTDRDEIAEELLENAPTVAAIPDPVKCGECEFLDNDGVHIYGMCRNPNTGNVKIDTDFCSYGKRKDGTEK